MDKLTDGHIHTNRWQTNRHTDTSRLKYGTRCMTFSAVFWVVFLAKCEVLHLVAVTSAVSSTPPALSYSWAAVSDNFCPGQDQL